MKAGTHYVFRTVLVFTPDGGMKRCGHAVPADKACSGHVLRNELKNKGIKTFIPANQMRKWRRMVVLCLSVIPAAIATLLNAVLAG